MAVNSFFLQAEIKFIKYYFNSGCGLSVKLILLYFENKYLSRYLVIILHILKLFNYGQQVKKVNFNF